MAFGFFLNAARPRQRPSASMPAAAASSLSLMPSASASARVCVPTLVSALPLAVMKAPAPARPGGFHISSSRLPAA